MLRKFFDILIPTADRLTDNSRNIYEEVSVFSLPNVVLFPQMALPLHIFEDRYKAMASDLARNDSLIAISPPGEGTEGKPTVNTVCGAGRVRVVNRYPDGRKDLLVVGLKRIRLVKIIQEFPYVTALAEGIPDIPFLSHQEEERSHERLSRLAKRWVFLSPDLDDSLINYVPFFTRPHRLADFIAFYFFPSASAKQEFLETSDREARVERAIAYAESRVKCLEAGGDMSSLSDRRPPLTECH